LNGGGNLGGVEPVLELRKNARKKQSNTRIHKIQKI